ncbi:hypothetical protein BDP27DRAFT_1321691 [Rhodocollybia butyracea]|uniref:Rho-GAP domain-containing protein n=1 Tax=Rhodocollybia butyracea TaxID=206335 RepID=A0A9P5PXD1_9AGAR|nr:hypothetical protein BDP27DRAFT_1321691 [Rhodocollybia butyracea]
MPPNWPDNSSLSSSFSSDSAVSGMEPDVVSSDHHRHAAGHDLILAAPNTRTSSLAVSMGQNFSKPSSKGASISNAAVNTGIKLKRAFAARRKKSEDATKLFASQDWDSPASQVTPQPSKFPRPTKLTLIATQVINGARRASQPSSPAPPTPPPKPQSMHLAAKLAPTLPDKDTLKLGKDIHKSDNRGSIIPISPGISSAVTFMRLGEEERERAAVKEAAKEDDQKDAWRKSDSTMSHHTIRPGAAAGPRSSRPVSMAESLQSNHTVVPVNKRLSALITDAEFGPPEEEDDSSFKSATEEVLPTPPATPSMKTRRSMSLNLSSKPVKVAVPPPPTTSAGFDDRKPAPRSPQEPHHPRMSPSLSSETPTLTRAAANGIIAPSSSGSQSTGHNIRGRLAAWTATNTPNSQHAPRAVPPSAYRRDTPSPQPHQRAVAVSITGSLAPAANLARRAAEKFGRWGGFTASSSSSGYSSSSSSAGYSSDNASSGQMPSGRGKQKRTPEAPSGAWSVSSSGGGSTSDSDAFLVPAGPSLGTQIRGSLRNASGGPLFGGILFGRTLSLVVQETAVGVGISDYVAGANFERFRPTMPTPGTMTKEESTAMETRRLPALVVRCAQHLLVWGVEEEGLFRLSGRPSHVAKLRNEFDTGADFNLQECSPGELDPHAVASVFKAFLRELPEPILTHSLLPYFEAALAHENSTNEQQQQQLPQRSTAVAGQRGPPLPSNPKSGMQNLRKPPSLSTLAMPNFSGMRPPSRSLLNALKTLLAKLPTENKDLIRTVVQLIKATAKESQQTKMPLSNLLLVFCPSLNMNPPLLRVLCEADDLWEVDDTVSVLDIKREDEVLDISPASLAEAPAAETRVEAGDYDDASMDAKETLASAPTSSTPHFSAPSTAASSSPSSSPPASARPSIEERRNGLRSKKPQGPRRAAHIPLVVHADDSHNTVPVVDPDIPLHSTSPDPDMSSLNDGSSYTSTSDTRSELMSSPFDRGVSPPPPLSSSAESLTTPSSSSVAPSLDHLPLENATLDKATFDKSVVSIPELDVLTPRKFLDSHFAGQIQFPTVSEPSPITPISPRIMSAPSLLLPSLSNSPSSTNSAPSSPRALRIKKPSLQLLFKKSSSSLSSPSEGRPFISSPMISSPHMLTQSVSEASGSSISTPSSAVTAPQSSIVPPVLNTPITSSPLQFGLGFDLPQSTRTSSEEGSDHNDHESHLESPISAPHVGETPIANRYCTPSSSVLSLSLPDNEDNPSPMPSHLRPTPTSRSKMTSKSSLLSTASNHLGLLDDEDQEDWTQSVLMAADWKF